MSSTFIFYRSLLIRRLPPMVVLFLLFTIAGVTAAMRLPSTYEAAARLIVETPQIPNELAASTVRASASEEIEFIRQRLFTRNNLLEIQQRFNVLPNSSQMSPDAIVEAMTRSTLITSFQSGAGAGGARPTLVSVKFTAGSGEVAANVVNEFVTQMISENVSQRTGAAEDTLAFFEQEVARLDDELALRSQRISDFQRQNADALPSDLAYRQSRISMLQERIAAAERERTTLAEQKVRMQAAFDQTGGFGDLQSPPQLSPDERELEDLRLRQAQALTIYSETNPNVMTLNRQIELLEAKIANQADTPNTEQNASAVMLDLQMSELESRIQSLNAEIASAEENLDALVDSVSRTPNISVTLDQLRRDYENVRTQYDNAVRSLSQANMGERIELTARGQRITLIEAATVPNNPSSPNRKRIAVLGTAAGLFSAIGFFLMMELINRTIRRPIELERALGITPIATIPYIESRSVRFARRMVKIGIILATTAAILATLYAVDRYYMPLEFIVQRLIRAAGI